MNLFKLQNIFNTEAGVYEIRVVPKGHEVFPNALMEATRKSHIAAFPYRAHNRESEEAAEGRAKLFLDAYTKVLTSQGESMADEVVKELGILITVWDDGTVRVNTRAEVDMVTGEITLLEPATDLGGVGLLTHEEFRTTDGDSYPVCQHCHQYIVFEDEATCLNPHCN